MKGQPGIDQIRNACGACCRTVPCCCSLKHRRALQPMMTREENQRGSGNPRRKMYNPGLDIRLSDIKCHLDGGGEERNPFLELRGQGVLNEFTETKNHACHII